MSKYIPFPVYSDEVPIDISFVFEEEKPAGKHGFLKAEGKHFVFEDGTRVRFWGTNFNGCGCFPEHDYAEKLAKRLANMGINLVRFHQLDAEWHTPNLFSFTKGKRATGSDFDLQSLDRLDYLIYCLKKEGIYCYMDMFVYRKFRSDEGVESAEYLGDAAKPYCLFSDKLIDLQKELCKRLWTHVNPYTSLAYCDDPVFVMAEIVNETSLFISTGLVDNDFIEPYRTEFLQKFDNWLQENRYEKSASEFDLKDTEDETLIDFKTYLHKQYYDMMYDWMRSCGVKIPIAGTNLIYKPDNTKVQLNMDFMDNHSYFYDWNWQEFEKRCKNEAITQRMDCFLAATARHSVADKPTYISEWDMAWPNEFRAESPLYCAAVGMLQDWSGYAIHTYSYTTKLERMNVMGSEFSCQKIGNVPYRQGVFSAWNDPAKFGLFYHAALITRREDVSPSQNTIAVKPISKMEWNKVAVHNAIETCQVVSDFSSYDQSQTTERIDAGEVLSDTGEIYRSWEKNYGYIDTEMTKCTYGFLEKNEDIKLNGLKVRSATDFAVIAMSSLTDKKLNESNNILLTAVGRAKNTDSKFDGDLMLDVGKPPILIEVIEADIELETSVSGLKVWAVSAEGFYIGTIPTIYEDGKLKFTIGKESQTMYYLIVKE